MGTVVVENVVDKTGSVQYPRIVRALGHGLDKNVIKAVKKCRFVPATELTTGRSVDLLRKQEVVFDGPSDE